MKIIVGLGNPGKQYERTRHNAGQLLVDQLAKLQVPSSRQLPILNIQWTKKNGIETLDLGDLLLVKSGDYFMNESGKMINDLRFMKYELEDLWVVHDDLDIRLGEYKIQKGKGPEVHGGVNDIERVIGKDFWRIRIGIDNRGTPRTPGEEYVLQKFEEAEVGKLELVINEITKGFVGGKEE